ncbi:Cytochrome c oxidase assembly protein ctag [Thalictrum thalictroides]|uniref:Cytochrome c oxidase assembly protein ctag n=1 Tax=Thalictrum thalictroides TaxID=46969 RepID=A0A7J6XEE4_THATH|nr:Cytochrome c oxidase assembly protein ctag [Thalictrum thalictroides]
MLFTKLSKKIPPFSSSKNPYSISKISPFSQNRFQNVESFTPTIYNNYLNLRKFSVSNNGFHSKSLISRNFDRISSSSLTQFENFRRHYSNVSSISIEASQNKKAKKIFWMLMSMVGGMVGLTYASVPLYRTFCQITGYGGTVQRKESVEEKIVRHDKDGFAATRNIVVQFNADVSDGMQWKFSPTQREIKVKPGESALAFYTAENCSSTPITGVSSYNVTPMKAGKYFNKIQCFCFEEQCLLPGEQIDMPVFFYIDPEIESDPNMDGVNNLILSYTFFKVPGK